MVSGLVVTARDRAHKWLYETFVQGHMLPTAEDRAIYQELATILKGGAIYHCGPIVKKDEDGWHLVAAGPTTSEREEPYEAAVMKALSGASHYRERGNGAREHFMLVAKFPPCI